MKLGHIELFVTDPLASKEFYRGVLGFEVTEVQGGNYVWLRLGETEILLRPGRPTQRPETYQQASSAMVLYTDNLPEVLSSLAKRGLTLAGTDGSVNCPTFTDLDGHWFQLVDPRNHT